MGSRGEDGNGDGRKDGDAIDEGACRGNISCAETNPMMSWMDEGKRWATPAESPHPYGQKFSNALLMIVIWSGITNASVLQYHIK